MNAVPSVLSRRFATKLNDSPRLRDQMFFWQEVQGTNGTSSQVGFLKQGAIRFMLTIQFPPKSLFPAWLAIPLQPLGHRVLDEPEQGVQPAS
jgi:hypothetical protein